MSKPLSPNLPPTLRDWMTENGFTEKSFSLSMGKSITWLTSLFRGESALSRYHRVADALNLSLDELIDLILEKKVANFLDKKIADREISSLFGLSSQARVSQGFVRVLYSNNGELKTISSYVQISNRTGIPLEKLSHRANPKSISA